MSMNVKQGDLAILIKSTTGASVGAICEVVEWRGRREWPDGRVIEHAWNVRFANPILVFLLGTDGKMHPHRQREAVVDDSWLKPISGLDDDDSIETEKTLPKEVETV